MNDLIKHIGLKNILFFGIISQYLLIFCYQVFIKFPHKRRLTRGIIFLITGILVSIIICSIDDTFSAPSNSIISGIIAILPLFAVKGNGIRDETKWRQDLKSWVSSDLDKSKGKIELKRLLRGSVSPEAIRFVNANKINLSGKLIKPHFLSILKIKVGDNEIHIISFFWSEPKLYLKFRDSEKYGRISAIDLYVATKVLDNNISMEGLRDVVSVLLKYDWDYANEKVPMFYWDN